MEAISPLRGSVLRAILHPSTKRVLSACSLSLVVFKMEVERLTSVLGMQMTINCR